MILTSTLAAVAAITTSQANFSEVVFLLDVSGSTDISQKALRGVALEAMQNQLDHYGEGNVRIALVTYGWKNERPRVHTFTTNPMQMIGYLAGRTEGFDDAREQGSNTAMMAIKNLDWTSSDKVKRKIMLLGNESLMQSPNSYTPEEVAEAAVAKDVTVDTVFTPYHVLAGGPKQYELLAFEGKGLFKLMNDNDMNIYTKLFDDYHQVLQREQWLRQDRKAKELYLQNLLNKRGG